MASGKRIAVYVSDDVYQAVQAYRQAGIGFNLARTAQLAMVDKMVTIERARRATGEPYLYTYDQLAAMKRKLDER